MHIRILGSGCDNCRRLEAVARDAVEHLGVDATFEEVTDPAEIATWGVMRTPALVVDDEVLVSGRVPTAEFVEGLLTR